MKRFNLILAVFFACFAFSGAYAQAGCCSHHGGVAGCNNSTGYQLCKDGSTSASCACSGLTPKAAAKTTTVKPVQKKTTVKSTTTQKTSTTTAAPATTATTTTTTTATTPTPAAMKTKGCCSRHGGVAQCNKVSGYLMCKDGSQSSNCSCS